MAKRGFFYFCNFPLFVWLFLILLGLLAGLIGPRVLGPLR